MMTPMELLRLINAHRPKPNAAMPKPKSTKGQFFEDLPIILINCMVVAVIAALAVLVWPISEEMMFAAAKAFILAFMVQLAKYLRGYEPTPPEEPSG